MSTVELAQKKLKISVSIMDTITRNRKMTGHTVYTTLLVIALVALIIGVGYLWYRDSQISGSWNPFKLPASSSVSMVDVAAPLI